MAFQLATNLEMGAKIPLDTRAVVSTAAERNAITQVYPGLTVYVTGENKYYYYDTNNSWIEFGSSQNLVYTTGDQSVSGIKTFNYINISGILDNPSDSTTRIGNILGISGKNISLAIGSQSIIDNGLIMTIHSGSGDIGGPNGQGEARAISFLRGSLVQGASSSYGIVFSGSSINVGGIRGYLTRSSLSPQNRGAVALDQATLVWTDRILSGQWSTNQRLLVNGTGVLLQGEGGGVSSIINTTYSTLTGLKAVTGLTPGQLYRISDFHLTWYNQSINDTGVKSGLAPEPLIVLALSGDKISHEAKSEIYPQDTVYYDIDASGSYSWGTLNNNRAIPNFKGWIYRRIDHQLNIDIGWDWRNITVNCCRPIVTGVPIWAANVNYSQYSLVRGTGINTTGKLYYSNIGSNSGNVFTNTSFWLPVSDFVEGDTYFSTEESYGFRAYNLYGEFISLQANTGARIQQPTFTSSLTGQGTFSLTNCNNIKIEGGYSNVIFGNNFRSNTIGNNFRSNTIGNSFQNNTIENSFFSNTIGIIFNSNTIGNDFYSNTIGNSFQSNNIGHSLNSNTIGNSFVINTIGNSFSSNTIGNNFSSNTIGNNFETNIIGNSFNTNTIGNSFFSNTIGINFYFNTIGNLFNSNTIGNSFNTNTIGNSFQNNIIGNNSNYNNIGNIFQNNTIGNIFYSNTIGNLFYFNTIGNSFVTNTIGNSFYLNTIGNSFVTNTIGNDIDFNIIGNSFRMNTLEDNLSIGNITGSTHIYNAYNTRIFNNSNGVVRLSFFNSSDQLVVTDPTS
jgi:hypothetical protein